MRGGVGSDAGLVEQLRCELAGERLDLACELAFLGGQLQDSAGDRAQREQAAAKLGIASAVRVAWRRGAAAGAPASAAAARCAAAPAS